MKINTKTKRWLVFYTRPRYEKKIDDELILKGIESFLPLHKQVKKWTDRKQIVEEPLFKSYIFAFVNEMERLKVLETKGIIKNVKFNGRIATISEFQIENIKKALMHRNESITIESKFEKGDRVKVISGPLEGMEGFVKHSNEGSYIIFEIDAINKALKIKLNVEDIIKIEKK